MDFAMTRNLGLLAASFFLLASSHVSAQDWPQFRGPHGAGVIQGGKVPPEKWTTQENVAWSVEVPGQGWSSPVIVGNRVYLTSCSGPEKVESPMTGYYKPLDCKTLKGEHRWTVHCLDASTGKTIWEKVAHKAPPEHPIHVKGSYAPETPIADAERVYAYFGNVGFYCFDQEGKELWSKSWGVFPTRVGWGTGASPILHGDRVYLVNDNEKSSFLIALDKKTGKELWKIPREEKSNWATPFVWENELRTEIITIGSNKVRSYDLDGKLLWQMGGMSSICVPSAIAGQGLLYISSGYEFGAPRPVVAVRPGGSGDISVKKGESNQPFVAWANDGIGAYHPTPILIGDYIYVVYSRGAISCFEAKTGKMVYEKQKLAGTFTASPVAYDGKIVCLSEEGIAYVVKAGAKFEILAKNDMKEVALATPAIAHGKLFIRTTTKLYCIAPTKEISAQANEIAH
jgi:outer membrane protein assembly factor BamB